MKSFPTQFTALPRQVLPTLGHPAAPAKAAYEPASTGDALHGPPFFINPEPRYNSRPAVANKLAAA